MLSVGERLWPPVAELTFLPVRLRHLGAIPAVCGNPAQARVVVAGEDDFVVCRPRDLRPEGASELGHRPTCYQRFAKLPVGTERNPSSVRGEGRRTKRTGGALKHAHLILRQVTKEDMSVSSDQRSKTNAGSVFADSDDLRLHLLQSHICRKIHRQMDGRHLGLRRGSSYSEYSRCENRQARDAPGKNVRQSRGYPFSHRDGQRNARRSCRSERGIYESLAKIGCGMESVRRKLLQSAQHGRVYVRWNGAALGGDRARLLGHHSCNDRLDRRASEGCLSNQHLVGHRTHSIYVSASVDDTLTHRLLRCHVRRRPE